jgi:1-deoxy-D-xylulose-5-phosphate synthase
VASGCARCSSTPRARRSAPRRRRDDAPAAAVELIHVYSLVHDDLPAMDNDDLRRGRPTCHRAFDEATAILTGDALQALSFEVLAGAPTPDMAEAAARLDMIRLLALGIGTLGMAGGQAIGGHFGAGLGVVELTVALHWLLRHAPTTASSGTSATSAYPHKILTGRRDRIHTVKQKAAWRRSRTASESEYDTFGVGHSSAPRSAPRSAWRSPRARTAARASAVAVIGDGAMTAGMAFEALNHAGGMEPGRPAGDPQRQPDVDLRERRRHDQDTSARMTGSRTLNALREGGKKVLATSTCPGRALVRRWEEHWKGMFVPGTLFEEWASTTPARSTATTWALVATLRNLRTSRARSCCTSSPPRARATSRPRATRSATTGRPVRPDSGSSVKPAARRRSRPTPRCSATGCATWPRPTRAHGHHAGDARGLGPGALLKEFPDRYFDVAIAEQHAVTLAAGMACEGCKPVVAIYSTFLQRGYDQLIHDVALQDLDVLFAIDRGGVVGPDGATHAGSFDLSYLRCIPNMLVMAPADENECRQMLYTGFRHAGSGRRALSARHGPGVAATVRRAGHAADRPRRLLVRREGGRPSQHPARLRRAAAATGAGGSRRRVGSTPRSSTCAS